MKILKNKNLICVLIILFLNFSMFIVGSGIINNNNTNNEIDNNLKASSNGREGKIFSTITRSSQDHYINRENPGLNDQPKISLQNHYISYARMNFENIEAENYTKDIETEPSEVILNFEEDPIYVYQKFFVEIDQYVNNLSIFIQDITFDQEYTEENSWEVAIVNCTDDNIRTPNSNETEILGKLLVRHPEFIEAHWELFDFENEGDGPIFLNTSETAWTIENGIKKYWFAFRVKIPGADVGPKFLYFNPDGEDLSDRGEGDTFIFTKSIGLENFTYNNVSAFSLVNGTRLSGDIDSFKELDNNRYTAVAKTNNLTKEIQFNVKNHSSGTSFDYYRNQQLGNWNFSLFSIDFEISVNVSNVANINEAHLFMYNYTGKDWLSLSEETDIDITTEDESTQFIKIDDPAIIQVVLHFLNETNNNSMLFKFEYNGTDTFSVSINKFTINIGELYRLNDTVQPYDPEISQLTLPVEVLVKNGTKIESDLLALEINDNFYYEAQADTNNLTIEFEFNLLTDLNTSLWDVSIYDWIFLYPNPLVPEIQIRIASNVSIDSPNNLTLAALEILDPEGNWFIIGNIDSFANETETFFVPYIPANETLNILQIMNKSQQNSLKMRLRYVGNPAQGFEKFNVTIDEFTFYIKTRNIYPSDFTSKIGFGLNSDTLLPENIEMKNLGVDITNVANQTGLWNANVPDGVPFQGFFEFNVTSLWHAISFDVSGMYEIYKFEIEIDFEDDVELRYMTGTNYFSVEVTNGTGDGIEDLEITFELIDEDGKVIDEDTAITNDDGIAKGALRFKKVGDGYKVKASYDKAGIYADDEKKSKEFRIVDEPTLVLDTFLLYLPFILALLVGITIFMVVRHQRRNKLRRLWAEDALVLDDLIKISYLLIIHKDAGVTIYNKQISMDLDSDLIGGFLTAISQFRSEIKKTGKELATGKGFEMDYYDFKIVIYDGDFVRVALILDGNPSKNLEDNQEKFTDRFEKRHGALLDDFSGDISPFGETDKLVDRIFEISLMYPLQLGKHWEFTKLNKLEQALVEVANQMQKERKFFFVSTLLSYGLAGRKATRDQIISTILNLKRRGIIVPVEIE